MEARFLKITRFKLLSAFLIPIFLLTVFSISITQTRIESSSSRYEEVIDSLYQLKEEYKWIDSIDENLDGYNFIDDISQRYPQDYQRAYSAQTEEEILYDGLQGENKPINYRLTQMASSEPQLRVAFDVSHAPTWQHDDAFLLDIYLDTINVELFYLWDIFELSEDIDVLLIPDFLIYKLNIL